MQTLTRKEEVGRKNPGHVEMVVLYWSIPIMVLGLAIATVPLLFTMWREERGRAARAADVTGKWANHDVDVERPARKAA